MKLSSDRKVALVIGSGGREHALAWKLASSPRVARVIVAPGNDGMPSEWERWPVDLSKGGPSFEDLARRAREAQVSLTVIGPDDPLAAGIADVFSAAGLTVFGPSASAARIEASKAFAKDVMNEAKVPTARYEVFKSAAEARRFLKAEWKPPGWVIKADGLALGKGVRVCGELAEALLATDELIGVSGRILVEERLSGAESSWMAFCDGIHASLFAPARDHKRLLDRDIGPNTGGMGAYSPLADLSDDFAERVRTEVFLPTLREMKRRGAEFRGMLYAGLMIERTESPNRRFHVLEFNARFGDPEAQVLLARMTGDLYDWCERSAQGDLIAMPERVPMKPDAALIIVGAADGYPDNPKAGARLTGLDRALQNSQTERAGSVAVPAYFTAGVRREESGLTVSGGRVFGAMGIGPQLVDARAMAYERLEAARFEGMKSRTDIGQPREVTRV